MLKQITLKNWKSFRHADLYIDPLTVIIGTNASGKSNLIDALDLLSRIANHFSLQEAFIGNNQRSGIRGGLEWVSYDKTQGFDFQIKVSYQEDIDYLYQFHVMTSPDLIINHEILGIADQVDEDDLFCFKIVPNKNKSSSAQMTVEYKTYNHQNLKTAQKQLFLFHRIEELALSGMDKNLFPILETAKSITNHFQNIFIYNPIPEKMRNYAPISPELKPDASNLAGVLLSLPEDEKTVIEQELQYYINQLPEGDIQKISAQPIGLEGQKYDAILYCEECWTPHQKPRRFDARAMSDGTLRFVAILTAMLTRPKGSLLVIEDVDMGLHPSRAGLLLKMLKNIGQKREIDILVTTHNPALLDAMTPDFVPFVMVTYRDPKTGESQLLPLDEIDYLPKLMASGKLGEITQKGLIEKNLKSQKQS